MGIGNYTNLSELMNGMLKAGQRASISDMVRAARGKRIILASEGELADQSDLENGFIALVDTLYRAGKIKPDFGDDMEHRLFQLYENGALARNGYGGSEGDLFLNIKWAALTEDLPVITNIRL